MSFWKWLKQEVKVGLRDLLKASETEMIVGMLLTGIGIANALLLTWGILTFPIGVLLFAHGKYRMVR